MRVYTDATHNTKMIAMLFFFANLQVSTCDLLAEGKY